MIDLDFTAGFIAQFEGFVGEVYLDAVGVETIGYGETRRDVIEQSRASGISQQEALDLLKRRVQEFADAVAKSITNPAALTPNRHEALTSLAYNIGVGAFQESTACKRFNAGNFDGVPEAIGWWNKGGGRVLAGLARRRAAECALFAQGAQPAGDPSIAPQTPECPPWPGRNLLQGEDGEDVRQARGPRVEQSPLTAASAPEPTPSCAPTRARRRWWSTASSARSRGRRCGLRPSRKDAGPPRFPPDAQAPTGGYRSGR